MTTMMKPDEQLIADLGREKARETAAHIAYLRHLRQLHERGFIQVRLAKIVGVSQPTISDMLRRARVDAPDVRPGTHGGGPPTRSPPAMPLVRSRALPCCVS